MSGQVPATAKKKASRRKSSGKTSVPLIAQPHGGALQVGNPGNKGGGRPRSHVRDDLLGTFDSAARPFLESVVRGDIVSKIRIPVVSAAKHLTCGKCGATGLQISSGVPADVEVEIQASATVSQRIDVAELMARYGVGQMKELTADAVRERVAKTLDVLQQLMSPEQFERACKELSPIWA